MPFRGDKFLILGDSNVGMFRDLLSADGSILGCSDVDFWYQTGSAFNIISIECGRVSSKARGAMPPVDLGGYDHIVWAGGRLRTINLFEALLSRSAGAVSEGFIRSVAREYIENLPAARSLRKLRDQFAGELIIVPTPLRGANVVGDERMEIVQNPWPTAGTIWSIYTEFAQDLGAVLLTTPRSMMTDDFFVKSCYNLSSDDNLHKNLDYARDILRQFKLAESDADVGISRSLIRA